MGRDSREDKLAPYFDDNEGYNWDFADVRLLFHINFCASIPQDVDAIRHLWHSASVAAMEDDSGSPVCVCRV